MTILFEIGIDLPDQHVTDIAAHGSLAVTGKKLKGFLLLFCNHGNDTDFLFLLVFHIFCLHFDESDRRIHIETAPKEFCGFCG